MVVKKMNIKTIPNLLSISRIPLSLVFAYLFLETITVGVNAPLSFLVFVLIILTDYLDGILSRKYNTTSSEGALLDATSDMFFVFCSYAVLSIGGLLNWLFLIVLLVKFTEFILTSVLNRKSDDSVLLFDVLGKNVSKFWIAFPGLICLAYLFGYDNLGWLINSVMLVTSILALLSTIYRIKGLLEE